MGLDDTLKDLKTLIVPIIVILLLIFAVTIVNSNPVTWDYSEKTTLEVN